MKVKNTINTLLKRNIPRISASFFFLGTFTILLVGCKKQDFSNGKDTLAEEYGINSVKVDTFDIITYSILEDSIRSSNNSHTLLGIYNDATFGLMNASLYTNLILQNPGTTNFTSSQTVDSLVLSLQYNGYYGTPEKMEIEVYELSELMSVEDTMYQFSTLTHHSENLVADGFSEYHPEPWNRTIVGDDTLSPHLRIRLKSSFGQHLIDGVQGGHYESNDNFKEFFKGLVVKVTEYTPNKDKGAIYYFNLKGVNSGLTVYYRDEDDAAKNFKYIVNNNAAYFNHVDVDRSNTKVEQLINHSVDGAEEFYAQAYGVRGIVEIPGLKNIPEEAIIHKAVLEMPFTSYYMDNAYPSAGVSIGYYEDNDFNKPKTIKGGNLYSISEKSYSIDLNNYTGNILVAQNIIRGLINTHTFFIIPNNYAISAERIIFNGKNTKYKKKPKLTVIYTIND